MNPERLLALRHQGYAPRSLLDIGAHLGGFTRMVRQVFPGCVATMIEPNPHCHDALSAMGVELHRVAASAEAGEGMLHLTREWPQSTGTSLYRENTHFFRDEVLEHATVPKVALDDVFAGRRFDLVKIDTQGSELDVLRGGRAVLAQADYILVEVSLVEFNAGGARAEAVFAMLASMGFRTAEVTEFHRLGSVQEGGLLQMDFMFERETPRPSQHARIAAEPIEGDHLAALVARRARSANFSLIGMGGAAPVALDASFGLEGRSAMHFAGNPNDRAGWDGLLRHVGQNGRFGFCLCLDGVLELAYPAMVLEMLPRIADAGLISTRVGGEAPWVLEEAGGEFLLASRFLVPRGASGFRHLHWRGAIAARMLNADYAGVTQAHLLGRLRQSLMLPA